MRLVTHKIIANWLVTRWGHIPEGCLSYTLIKPNLCLANLAVKEALKTPLKLWKHWLAERTFFSNHGIHGLPNLSLDFALARYAQRTFSSQLILSSVTISPVHWLHGTFSSSVAGEWKVVHCWRRRFFMFWFVFCFFNHNHCANLQKLQELHLLKQAF